MSEDYMNLNKELYKDEGFFKVFSVPARSKLTDYSIKNPTIYFSDPDINTLFGRIPTWEYESFFKMAEMLFSDSRFQDFLDIGGVRYIVLNDDDDTNQDNAYYWYGSRSEYKEILEKYLIYLPKKSIGNIDVYENKSYL